MNQWEWLARGFAELGSPSGDGVSGGAQAYRSKSGCFPIEAENHSGVCATGQERPHDERPADSKFDVAATAGDYSSASQGQCADSSTGGEVFCKSLPSPLQQFAEKSANGLSTGTFLGVERGEGGPKRPTLIPELAQIQPSGSEGDRRYLGAERIVKSAFPESQSFPADDRFADNIARFMDAVERCEERSRR